MKMTVAIELTLSKINISRSGTAMDMAIISIFITNIENLSTLQVTSYIVILATYYRLILTGFIL